MLLELTGEAERLPHLGQSNTKQIQTSDLLVDLWTTAQNTWFSWNRRNFDLGWAWEHGENCDKSHHSLKLIWGWRMECEYRGVWRTQLGHSLTFILWPLSLSLSAVLSSEKCLSLCLKFNHKHCHYSSNVPLCERETDRLTQDKFLNFLHSLIDIWTDSDGDCINDRRRNSRKIPQFILNSILFCSRSGRGRPRSWTTAHLAASLSSWSASWSCSQSNLTLAE